MPEGQPPTQIKPESLDDYLEVMSKNVFQSGMSWRVVEAKWPGTREAFEIIGQENIFLAQKVIGASVHEALDAAENWIAERQKSEAAETTKNTSENESE